MPKPKNHGTPWSDWQLALVLRDGPFPENVHKWAERFERKASAIELIYRWAYSSREYIEHQKQEHRLTGTPVRVWEMAREMGLLVQNCK